MANTLSAVLLNGVTSTGDGPVLDMVSPQYATAVQAEIFGAPATCVINVMGLLLGGTWDTLAVLDISGGYISGQIQPLLFPAPIIQVKGNISTLTASGPAQPSVNLYFTANSP